MRQNILKYLYFSTKKIVIYLHGGPDFRIDKATDDPFVRYLLKNGCNVVVINYPLVPGEGGVSDLAFVRQTVSSLLATYDEYTFYLLGDSYGGYLASLLLDIPQLEQIIVVSGFVSLSYQALFSTERAWLQTYMAKDAIDFFEVSQTTDLNLMKIIFIQGTGDKDAPIGQFDGLSVRVKVKKLVGFKHRETSEKLAEVLALVLQQIK